jgi:hypothetical protein
MKKAVISDEIRTRIIQHLKTIRMKKERKPRIMIFNDNEFIQNPFQHDSKLALEQSTYYDALKPIFVK